MTNEKNPTYIDDILFESEMIPTFSDMEMMLTQDGIRLSNHAKDYLAEIASLKPLDANTEKSLLSRLEEDESAKNALIEGNMRLVICTAKRYCGRGVQLLDLLQEGSLGLVNAVEGYSAVSASEEFKHFAVTCIVSAIEDAISEAEASRKIPEHVMELLNKISRSDMTLEEKLGREATPEEIAADTGLSLDEVTAMMEMMEDVASHEAENVPLDDSTEASHDGECTDSECHEHHHTHYNPGKHTHS